MKEFYLSKDQITREGPFKIEQLETKLIDKESLVWFEGLEEWKKASEIKDLDYITKKKSLVLKKQIKSKPIKSKPKQKTSPKAKYNSVTHASSNDKEYKIFSNVFSKKGRIGRLEYFISYLTYYFVYGMYVTLIETAESISYILFLSISFWIATYIIIVQGAKRCHDRGNSGFYQLIPFYFLFMLFGKGEDVKNKYGSSN